MNIYTNNNYINYDGDDVGVKSHSHIFQDDQDIYIIELFSIIKDDVFFFFFVFTTS